MPNQQIYVANADGSSPSPAVLGNDGNWLVDSVFWTDANDLVLTRENGREPPSPTRRDNP